MLHQGFEEGWQQTVEVFARGAGHLASEEWHGVFEQVQNAAQLIEFSHGIGRGVFQGHLFAQGENRQVRRTHPRQADQLGHVVQQMRASAGVLGGDQHARETVMGRGDEAPLGVIGRRNDAEAFLLQLPGDAPHTITGDGVGLDVAMDDQDREFQIFIHEAQCPEAAGRGLPITSG